MSAHDSSQEQLRIAETVLANLKEKQAGYTFLTVPAELRISIEEKEEEVRRLRAQLAPLATTGKDGMTTRATAFLPRRKPFIGRKRELEDCLKALDRHHRSWGVVIDGIGGIGKTTLAVEAAHIAHKKEMFDAYLFVAAKTTFLEPDNKIRRQELQFSSLAAFIREFARQLGYDDVVHEKEESERTRKFAERISDRRVLLIWDNLETLPEHERDQVGAFLAETLPEHNKAIVTSRRRTAEAGATVIRLGKLSESEGRRMISEFQSAYPTLNKVIAEAGEASYRELYEASYGNPLLLEWVLLNIDRKAIAVAKAITLLREAERSGNVYAFIFKDTVDDLTDQQREVLSVLAFEQATTTDMIKGATNLTANQVEEALQHLVLVSLVNDVQADRVAVNPLMRVYAQTALYTARRDRQAIVRDVQLNKEANRRMLRQWVKFAEEHGGDNSEEFDILEKEMVNVESTAKALYDLTGLPGEVEDHEAGRLLVALAHALCNFEEGPLLVLGYWDESIQVATWAYDAALALGDWESAMLFAGSVCIIYGRREDAHQTKFWYDCMETSLAQMKSPVATGGVGYEVTRVLSILLKLQDNPLQAEKILLEELERLIAANDIKKLIYIYDDLGSLKLRMGYALEADRYYVQALERAEQAGHKHLQARIHNHRGDLAMGLSPMSALEDLLNPILSATGGPWWKTLLAGFGMVLIKGIGAMLEQKEPGSMQKDPDSARPHYERAYELANEAKASHERAYAARGLAEVFEREGKFKEAHDFARDAFHIYQQSGDPKLKDAKDIMYRVQSKMPMAIEYKA